jgi:hypothetical protein
MVQQSAVLTIDESNYESRTRIISKSLNRRARNKMVPPQHRIPNGRKVGAIACGCRAFEHQVICRSNHAIVLNMSA